MSSVTLHVLVSAGPWQCKDSANWQFQPSGNPLATQDTSPAGDSCPVPGSCWLSQRRCTYSALSIALLLLQHPNPELPEQVLGFLPDFCGTFLEVQPLCCDELFHVKSRWSSLSPFLQSLCASSEGCVGRTPAHSAQH